MAKTLLRMVTRLDDNGGDYLIQAGLDKAGADALMVKMARGHKQTYSVIEYVQGDLDAMMTRLGIKRYGLVPA